MIHFDANFLVAALAENTAAAALLDGGVEKGEEVAISTVAYAEFLCGPLSADAETESDSLFPEPIPLIPQDAKKAAELFNATGRRSRSLSDCLIAATAIRLGASLATYNRDDFVRFAAHGLRLL